MGTIAVCILAVTFTGFSIYSVSNIASQANQMYEHPYRVRMAAQSMQTRLAEMRQYLPTLLQSDYQQNVNEVKDMLHVRDQLQDESLATIRQYYLGDPQDVVQLEVALKRVREARLAAVDLFGPAFTLEETTNYTEVNVNPYSDQVNEVLLRIANTADGKIHMMLDTAQQTKVTATIGALVLCAMIVALAVVSNISEWRKGKEIAYREKLFDLLATSIDDVFFIFDHESKKMEYVSENCTRLLEMRQEQFYQDAMALKEHLTPESMPKLLKVVSPEQLAQNNEVDLQYILHGKVLELKLRLYPIYSKEKLQRSIAVLSDQTQAIERQNALTDALNSAHKANNAKRDFLSRMSHEIRTPMNTIIGMTTIALRHFDDLPYVEGCLKKITTSSGHLLSLVNDVLDMSKIDDSKLVVSNEPFDFRKLIESVTSMIYPQATDNGQNFEVILTGITEETFTGDALRIHQVLINLLSNAIKFTPAGGDISLEITQLRVKKSQVFLRFVVRDTGIGMSEDFLANLYSPFEQADPSIAQKYGGTGLGMSIAKNLVTLMNGSISVKSAPGEGTEFTVELPLGRVEGAEIVHQDAGFDTLQVLVVDDDQSTCEHTTVLLEQLGIHANWVCSGKEAVALTLEAHQKGNDYDVCFIDWCMPDMDGVETARAIRKHLGPDTLIIIISAYDWSVIEQEARDAGVNGFISKPLFTSSIYNTLNTIVMPRSARAAVPAHEDSAYDFRGKRILLVEDNVINQEIAMVLLNDVGLLVDCAQDGQEAVEIFISTPPATYSLILMDVQMPRMNGYEATRAIRSSKHPGAGIIPILAMTANAFNEDVALAKEAGMNGHLSKPIDVDVLYSTIAQYLR